MFKTLRHKLLFWFLLFLSTNFIIIFINLSYLNQREQVAEVLHLLEESHGFLLEDYKNHLNFFTQETKNKVFFEFGASASIDSHKRLFVNIKDNFNAIKDHKFVDDFGLNNDLLQLEKNLELYDTIFFELVGLVQKRGFKDYNVIGEIRKSAHLLEVETGIDQIKLLQLRRNEKDFLLRYENIYLSRHNAIANGIRREVNAAVSMPEASRTRLLEYLDKYLADFKKLVLLDGEIGLYDNSGMKMKLDNQEVLLAEEFLEVLRLANEAKEEQLLDLKLVTAVITGLFIVLGILSSFLISRRITMPLTDLTTYIARFVQSEFTFTTEEETRIGRDEIGKLTLNFNTMRDKIIEQLQFFKQKVDERTVELAEANNRLVRINEANQRFVPNEFLHFLKKESIEEVSLGDNIERDMAIMFSDIRGFTEFSEKMTPQENFHFINSYLKEIVPHVREHDGFVDKYIGDSVMALFAGRVDDAINSAIDSEKSVRRFNETRERAGKHAIRVGIGIHCGNLVLGTVGEQERMETTVISDAVNTASRVEGLTSVYAANILISQAVFDKIQQPENYDLRFVDTVKVKGKERAVRVYEVLNGLESSMHELRLQTMNSFGQGVACFENKEFIRARELFEEVCALDGNDLAASLYLARCHDLITNGVPEDWSSTKSMDIKK